LLMLSLRRGAYL